MRVEAARADGAEDARRRCVGLVEDARARVSVAFGRFEAGCARARGGATVDDAFSACVDVIEAVQDLLAACGPARASLRARLAALIEETGATGVRGRNLAASTTRKRGRAAVFDRDAVPDKYWERVLRLEPVTADLFRGLEVPGARLDRGNGGPVLVLNHISGRFRGRSEGEAE